MTNTTSSPSRSESLVPAHTARAVAKLLSARLAHTSTAFQLAGSLRRGAQQVHDIEFVASQRMVEATPAGGFFAEPEMVPALWHALDELVESGVVTKALYTNGFDTDPATGDRIMRPMVNRWGDKQRGIAVHLPGRPPLTVEFYTCPPEFFGSTLLTRTGPAQFGRLMALRLRKNGYAMKDGKVVKLISGEPSAQTVDCPDEREVFKLANLPFIPAESRDDYWRAFG